MSVYLIKNGADNDSAPFRNVWTKHRVPLSLYPDNSPVLNVKGGMTHPDVKRGEYVAGMLVNYHTYDEFVTAMNVAFTMKSSYAMETLYLPYVPGGRQDKPRNPFTPSYDKSTGDILRTLEFTVQLIKIGGFKEVHVLDPHSGVFEKLAGNYGLKVVVHQPDITKHLNMEQYDGIIAPDAGATERALVLSKATGLPLFLGQKHRDPVTNKLTGFGVSKLPTHGYYLVVDDICDGGGTFMGLGEEIKKERARADLYVTHGLFTHGADKRLSTVYKNIFSSDSIGYEVDGVSRLPMVDRMFAKESEKVLEESILQGER